MARRRLPGSWLKWPRALEHDAHSRDGNFYGFRIHTRSATSIRQLVRIGHRTLDDGQEVQISQIVARYSFLESAFECLFWYIMIPVEALSDGEEWNIKLTPCF